MMSYEIGEVVKTNRIYCDTWFTTESTSFQEKDAHLLLHLREENISINIYYGVVANGANLLPCCCFSRARLTSKEKSY